MPWCNGRQSENSAQARIFSSWLTYCCFFQSSRITFWTSPAGHTHRRMKCCSTRFREGGVKSIGGVSEPGTRSSGALEHSQSFIAFQDLQCSPRKNYILINSLMSVDLERYITLFRIAPLTQNYNSACRYYWRNLSLCTKGGVISRAFHNSDLSLFSFCASSSCLFYLC